MEARALLQRFGAAAFAALCAACSSSSTQPQIPANPAAVPLVPAPPAAAARHLYVIVTTAHVFGIAVGP